MQTAIYILSSTTYNYASVLLLAIALFRAAPPNMSRTIPKKMSFIAVRLSQRGRIDVIPAATKSHMTQMIIQPLKKFRENT
jgi:hypothetical protein